MCPRTAAPELSVPRPRGRRPADRPAQPAACPCCAQPRRTPRLPRRRRLPGGGDGGADAAAAAAAVCRRATAATAAAPSPQPRKQPERAAGVRRSHSSSRGCEGRDILPLDMARHAEYDSGRVHAAATHGRNDQSSACGDGPRRPRHEGHGSGATRVGRAVPAGLGARRRSAGAAARGDDAGDGDGAAPGWRGAGVRHGGGAPGRSGLAARRCCYRVGGRTGGRIQDIVGRMCVLG
jgi:hypothetical protein